MSLSGHVPTSAPRPESFADIETGPESEEIIRKFMKPYKEWDEEKLVASIKKKYSTARNEVKGPAFIKEKVEEAKIEHEIGKQEHWEETVDRAPLDPLMGRVLAIGIRQDNRDVILIAETDEEEKQILQIMLDHHSDMASRGGIVNGFNWEGFDNEFLISRMQKYRLPWQPLRPGRYMSNTCHDLLTDWRGGNKTEFIKLDTLAEFLETEHRKNGDGAHFHQTFKEDRPKAISYLCNDLIMTHEVGAALGVAREPVVSPRPTIIIQGNRVISGIEAADRGFGFPWLSRAVPEVATGVDAGATDRDLGAEDEIPFGDTPPLGRERPPLNSPKPAEARISHEV